MKIALSQIATKLDRERCYVHARGVMLPGGFGIITMQKLELSGSDLFYGIEMIKTENGGKTFSEPTVCQDLRRRYFADGTSEVMSDATPFYHEKTGKIILVGHLATYGADNKGCTGKSKSTVYAVYDDEKGDFSSFKAVEMPENSKDEYYSSGSGCSQIYEEKNGDLLIPFYYQSYENAVVLNKFHVCSAVMRCSFDGETLSVSEIGNGLTVDVPRGICEPSVTKFKDTYYLALRNDLTGYLSKSKDGINYEKPVELCFDNRENLGNYNTQQHWIVGGGRLWLVYTRRAGNNDHVFRHRAPLFIAQLDTETMQVIKDTERIAVPQRGARLGNFGCQSYSDNIGYVFASEWMQGDEGLDGCMRYGSDNSIFISRIEFE